MKTWIWELSIGDRDEKFEERHEYMGWILSNGLYSYMQFSNNKKYLQRKLYFMSKII